MQASRSRHGDRLLSLRTVRGGAETVSWPKRTVRIDADVYVVGDGLRWRAAPIEADTKPLVVDLQIPEDSAFASADFVATLRPMVGPVGRSLAEFARLRPGVDRVALVAEAAASVWSDLLGEERALRDRADRIDCAKASTRQALFRRVLASADFIQSNYAEPLRVAAFARESHLSPFHFARLFALVMGETPHAFLVRKRIAVARRLLANGVQRGEAAVRAGFGCRSTLFRHLRDRAAEAS